MMGRRETGIQGEKLACNFLANNGYRIIETNYRCRDGEVDVVTQQRDVLVFVEVRTKKNLNFGTPEESITERKKEKLRAVAEHYTQNHENLPPTWRIDVVAVQLNYRGRLHRIEIIENAVEG
jgi:putative endonuclease